MDKTKDKVLGFLLTGALVTIKIIFLHGLIFGTFKAIKKVSGDSDNPNWMDQKGSY